MQYSEEDFESNPLLKKMLEDFKRKILKVLKQSLAKYKDLNYKLHGFNLGHKGIDCSLEMYMAVFGDCMNFEPSRFPHHTSKETTFKVRELDFWDKFYGLDGYYIKDDGKQFHLKLDFPFITFFDKEKEEMLLWVNTLVTEYDNPKPIETYNRTVLKLFMKREEQKEKKAKIVKPKKTEQKLNKMIEDFFG